MSSNDRGALGRAIFDAVQGVQMDLTRWDDPVIEESTREEYRREADYLLSLGWHHQCYPALDHVRRENLKLAKALGDAREEIARLKGEA